ncbi:diacylglycerol/lipid kinase family protein [Rhodospirillum sp. A1_3_36]|uniref:diacylglycerol/lipid kinase family protein n=1 Tax=Rhodospirillum sp. A1_3_36 TaxID=3391666 RepID=UPI0039A442FE
MLIIHNQRAAVRREARFRAVLDSLKAAGCPMVVQQTQAAGDAGRFAAAASRRTFDLVVVAGGDGTINDTINGFTPDSPALGLIPLGTANVLAHELGQGMKPDAIVRSLIAGQRIAVYPGVVNGRRFMMMAGVGFDAHVVNGVKRPMKLRLGKLAYALEALRQLVLHPCPPLDAQIDGRPVVAATLVAQRGRLYGGRFTLAPDANLKIPLFQATLFPRAGRLAMAGYSAALPLGLLTRLGLVEHVEARCIEVAGHPGDPVQADGDVIAHLPAKLTLDDHPIHITVPPTGDSAKKPI